MEKIVVSFTTLLLTITFSPETAYPQEYELVWSDEFNGDSLDTETWNFWKGTAYNNELQYYTPRAKNAYLKDGKLYLEAHREAYMDREFISARISTDSTRIGWKQGRFEARLKIPEGKGFWPAFWLMPIRDIGWPKGVKSTLWSTAGTNPIPPVALSISGKEVMEGKRWNAVNFLWMN